MLDELSTALQALIAFSCVFLFISTLIVVLVGYYKSKFYDIKFKLLNQKIKEKEKDDIQKVVIINETK